MGYFLLWVLSTSTDHSQMLELWFQYSVQDLHISCDCPHYTSHHHACTVNYLKNSFCRCWWKKNIISSRHMNIYVTGHGFLDTFSDGIQTQTPLFLGTLCSRHRRRRSQTLCSDLCRRSIRRGHTGGEGCQELILQLVVLGDCGWLNCFCLCCHISSGKFMKFDLKTKVLICAIKEIWNH